MSAVNSSHSILVEDPSKSLAKWKRDAETGYKKDTVMFKGLLHTAEANVVRIRFICVKSLLMLSLAHRKREMTIKVWQQF